MPLQNQSSINYFKEAVRNPRKDSALFHGSSHVTVTNPQSLQHPKFTEGMFTVPTTQTPNRQQRADFRAGRHWDKLKLTQHRPRKFPDKRLTPLSQLKHPNQNESCSCKRTHTHSSKHGDQLSRHQRHQSGKLENKNWFAVSGQHFALFLRWYRSDIICVVVSGMLSESRSDS